MKLDSLALICVCLAVGVWLLLLLGGVLAAGPIGFILLIPLLIVGYFVGSVISQRLNNKDDDYYDKVEK